MVQHHVPTTGGSYTPPHSLRRPFSLHLKPLARLSAQPLGDFDRFCRHVLCDLVTVGCSSSQRACGIPVASNSRTPVHSATPSRSVFILLVWIYRCRTSSSKTIQLCEIFIHVTCILDRYFTSCTIALAGLGCVKTVGRNALYQFLSI